MSAKPRMHPARATLSLVAVVVAVAAAGIVAFGGSAAQAAAVSCGDTITTDTTLNKDLVNCPNNGIIIGADNITLNLNSHTIDGDGTAFPGCSGLCDSGVLDDGHSGVTIKHGSVRQFSFGLNLGPVRHTRVLGISTVESTSTGILCFKCVRSLVRDSAGSRTKGFGEEAGMSLFDSHHTHIVNSSFRRNAHLGILFGGSGRDESTDNAISGNLFAHNGDEGILMGGKGFQISHNRLVRNGGGITLGPGSHDVIKRNHVSRGSDGIRIEKGHDNLVAHNLIDHARRAGIRLGIKHPFLGGAHNVVRRNRVRDSRVDGFLVGKKDGHSLLKNNVAKRAGDDGFDIASRSAKLTSNRAMRNGDLGIEAVPGVNDGGGNVARHNGDPRQCTNIVCS